MTKRARLQALSNDDGVIAALAMDQRKSLRTMIAAAEGSAADSVPDSRLAEFKTAVTRVLTPHASAVLLDPEYGLEASRHRAGTCGLLMTYEADGFENPRPHRMLALMPHVSVTRIRDHGASGVKVLLSWAPDDDENANEAKRALVERIGAECDALGMPFLLEPVVYDAAGQDPKSAAFAKRKPELVVRTMEEFSRPVYGVDVLKVEFPLSAARVEGCGCCSGPPIWTMKEALDWYRAADSAARRPYVYLSAGVSFPEFSECLELAAASGARFSGVLCGRATWQEGVKAYAAGGSAALTSWLEDAGVRNIRAINDRLRAAKPWQGWFESTIEEGTRA